MTPSAAAAATERYFRELPRVIHHVCEDWARKTSNVLRRLTTIPPEVRKTISGKALRYSGESFARLMCESPIGLYIERGTGIFGPFKRPIRAKGGAYVDALGRKRERHMLRWKGTVWGGGSTTVFQASGTGGGVSYRKRKGPGLGVSGSSGYIYAFEVKGSPARPWFVPGIEHRIPLFESCLRTNMGMATESIRMNMARPRFVPSG